MATIKAIASGNWSATTTWTGGVIPGINDIATANGFIITIDQDIAVQAISNSTFGTSTSGGFFQITTLGAGVTRNVIMSLGLGDVSGTYIGTTGGLLRISATSGTVDMGSTNIRGGSAFNYSAIFLSGSNVTLKTTGNLLLPLATNASTITDSASLNNYTIEVGDIFGRGISLYGSKCTIKAKSVSGGNAGSTSGIHIYGGQCTVIADSSVGGGTNTHGISLSSRFNKAFITGSVTGGTGSNSFGLNFGLNNNIGSVGALFASSSSSAMSITTNGNVLEVRGAVVASSVFPAIVSSPSNTDVLIKIKGPIMDSSTRCAVNAYKFITYPTSENQTLMYKYDSTGAFITLSNYHPDSPPPSDVRKGISYGPNNQLTGTMSVPTAQSVSVGVPVDGTIGSAVLSGGDVLNSEISSGVTIANRISNIATVSSTGEQLKAALSSST